MSNRILKRIAKEIKNIQENPPQDIYIYPDQKNIRKLTFMIVGSENTPYFGGYYFFKLTFPEKYPFEAPDVKFKSGNGTAILPNSWGEDICYSLLNAYKTVYKHKDTENSWTSAMSLNTLLVGLQSFMNSYPRKVEEFNYKYAINGVLNKTHCKHYYDMFENEILYNYKKNKEMLMKNEKYKHYLL